jgi:hypothetical protein
VLVGLVVIPGWNAGSGIVVAQGTTVQVDPDNGAIIPFSASQQSKVSGSVSANAEIEVYLLNSAQFITAADSAPGLPNSYVFASGNVTSLALNLTVAKGSYYLVFYSAPSDYPRQVVITQAIELTPM